MLWPALERGPIYSETYHVKLINELIHKLVSHCLAHDQRGKLTAARGPSYQPPHRAWRDPRASI